MSLGDFAYANHSNRFLGAASLHERPHTPFVLAGVPFDGAVTHRPGARFGPQAIRTASLMLCDGIHPLFNVSPLAHVADAGDMRLPNASPLPEVRAHIERQATALMAQHHTVFLGGDHSVTLARPKSGLATASRWPWCTLMPIATPGPTTSASLRATAPGRTKPSAKTW